MDDIHHRCLHSRYLQVLVSSNIKLSERLSQRLCIRRVHCHELQYPVLSYYINDHGPFRIIINVDQRYTTCPRIQHAATGFVERFGRIDGDGFDW